MRSSYFSRSVSPDEAVEWASVADVASLPTTGIEDGDEIVVDADGYIRKRINGVWEIDTTKPRVYSDDAARLARTGFTPAQNELFRVNGGLLFVSSSTNPTDSGLDQQQGGSTVPLASVIDWPSASAGHNQERTWTPGLIAEFDDFREQGWQYSTDGVVVSAGQKIIVAPDHAIDLSGITDDLSEVTFAPATGDWADIAQGTGAFNPAAGDTFGANQVLLYGSDVLRAVYNAANANWILFSGGEDAPSQSIRVELTSDLPDATTLPAGTEYIVVNDGANSRPYIARGPLGGNALAWS